MREITLLVKEISKLLAVVAAKNQSLSFLSEELKVRDTRIEELRTNIATKGRVIRKHLKHHTAVDQSTITKLNREITELRSDLSNSGTHIRELQISLSRKKKGFKDNIKKLNDSCEEKVKFLEENRDNLLSSTRCLEEANFKLIIESRRLRDEIDCLKQDSVVNNRLREKTEKPERNLAVNKRLNERVESQASQLVWIRGTEVLLIKRIRSLKEELDLSNKEIKIQKKELTDEIRDLNEEKDDLVKEWKVSEEARSSLSSNLEHWEDSDDILVERIESLKEERDRFQAEWRASEEARGILEAELAEYMKQVGNSEFMEGFDPIPCHGIDFWIKTKEKNGEISDENERL